MLRVITKSMGTESAEQNTAAVLLSNAARSGAVVERSILPVQNVIGDVDQRLCLVIVAMQTGLVCLIQNKLQW